MGNIVIINLDKLGNKSDIKKMTDKRYNKYNINSKTLYNELKKECELICVAKEFKKIKNQLKNQGYKPTTKIKNLSDNEIAFIR